MTLGTPVITRPGDAGALVPKARKFLADDAAQLAKIFDFPDISVVVTTSTNDSGLVLNLSDYFDFPSNMIIPVYLRHYAQTENDRYYQELSYMIVGSETAGTDPVIIGDGDMSTGVQGKIREAFGVLNGAAQAYGRVSLNVTGTTTTTTEATDGTNSHGVSIGAWSTGVGTLVLPLNRTARVVGWNAAEDAGTIGDVRHLQVRTPLTSTGGTVDIATINGTEALADPTGSNQYTVTFDLYPPVNAFLVMNGTPDPGEIGVYVSGISSDEVKHRVDVFIGQPIDATFYGS
jgi:hypothetical protein